MCKNKNRSSGFFFHQIRSQLKQEWEKCAVISIYSSASNHKDWIILSAIDRCFDPETGIQFEILHFVLLPVETKSVQIIVWISAYYFKRERGMRLLSIVQIILTQPMLKI